MIWDAIVVIMTSWLWIMNNRQWFKLYETVGTISLGIFLAASVVWVIILGSHQDTSSGSRHGNMWQMCACCMLWRIISDRNEISCNIPVLYLFEYYLNVISKSDGNPQVWFNMPQSKCNPGCSEIFYWWEIHLSTWGPSQYKDVVLPV